MSDDIRRSIVERLASANVPNTREYVDPKTNLKFEIKLSSNLSDIVRLMTISDETKARYSKLYVDGEAKEIDSTVVEMCYRLVHTVCAIENDKRVYMTMEDWLFLSLHRADLIFALNSEISDMLLSSVNSKSPFPLVG
jgi:hypothetical protein